MNKIILLMAGGAVGTLLRYLISTYTQRSMGSPFPFGTLTVNLVGCLIIGILAGMNMTRSFDENLKLLLFTGLLGGFTTFSSFGLESLQLIRDGRGLWAIGYLLISNAGGILLAWTGYSWMSRG